MGEFTSPVAIHLKLNLRLANLIYYRTRSSTWVMNVFYEVKIKRESVLNE